MSIRLRPTFSIPFQISEGELFEQLQAEIDRQAESVKGQFKRGHGMISINDSKRHFWSPWLHLHVVPPIDDQSPELFGRFSPHPSIWTAVMFSYLALCVIVFFLCVIGMSQFLANEYPWGFWGIPLCLVIAVVIWIVSQAGQRLAHDEMVMLKQMVESAVER